MKIILLGAALAGALLTTGGAALAKSIKHDVPAATLASFCAEQGVGSENQARLTLADGTTLSGSIHCEAEDLVAGNDDNPATHDVADDHGGHGNEPGDDNGGNRGNGGGDDNSGRGGGDDGAGHDAGDDNGGGGESGHGDHGGDD